MMQTLLILFVASFLIGSIPFGLLIARALNIKDLQSQGSGNIGATNVARIAGFWPGGFFTFLLDYLKGAVPVFIVSFGPFQSWWQTQVASNWGADEIGINTIWMTGLAAVLGHCFSPWVRFKGGKGVATGLGVITVLAPLSALIGVLGFLFCFFKTRVSSLSSVTGLLLAAIAYLVSKPTTSYGPHLWVGAALIFLILYRHESNIDALLDGRERKF
jgi:glycerol-3-phosphate acyltransferase PlsY